MTDVPGESQRGDASAAKRDGRPETAGESTETSEAGSPQELGDTPESTGFRESDSDSADATNSAERGDERPNAGDSSDSGITNDAEIADDVDATTASAQTSDNPAENTVDTTQPVNLADGVNAEHAPHRAGIPGQDNTGNAEQAPPPPQYPIPPDAGMPHAPGAPPHPGMPVNAGMPPYPRMPPQPPPPLLGMPPQSPKPPPLAHWPEPDIAGTPKALLGALISGAGVAIFLPLRSLGIGITLLGLALALGMLVTARANNTKIDLTRVGWTVLALLLLTVPTFRDSQWLYALCLLTACVAGMFAVAAPRKPLEFAMSVCAIPVGAFRALPWSARGTREARSNSRNGLRLTVSVIVSLVLLVLFGALFSGADTRFAELVSAVIPEFDAESVFRLLILLPFFALAGLGAAFTLLNRPTAEDARGPGRKLRHLEWALPVGVLTVLFLVFVGMQIPALLSGEQLIRSPTDLTYADYARSGFWQLTAVTVLTLPIIGAAARWAPQNTRFDRTLLRALGGALSALTLVIVVCALVRMSAYQQAYGFTVLRLLVETCEIWIGAVYLMILVAGIRLRARWLPGLVLATGMVTLLGLAAANPEGVITANNIARYQATGKIDAHYLTDMSGDAVPALRAMPDGEDKRFIRSSIQGELRAHDDQWRSWNLSRVNAWNELGP